MSNLCGSIQFNKLEIKTKQNKYFLLFYNYETKMLN